VIGQDRKIKGHPIARAAQAFIRPWPLLLPISELRPQVVHPTNSTRKPSRRPIRAAVWALSPSMPGRTL